ncbi:hypothetical protein PVAND_014162 [Polypedilum vanderplanki]|uniref:RAP domain-containing protein n=1 Tax=Polypedilum vanderplanki TaxID=319348 RepID=A0A9J6CSR9_POLVA|nr:hypothetical protein PVAND_014162 [Polypedilum vanderplanki]
MFRKVCLQNNFSKFSLLFRSNLLIEHNQKCVQASTIIPTEKKKIRESVFLAQFVPNYVKEERLILDQNIFKIEENYNDKTPSEIVDIFKELSYHGLKMEKRVMDPEFEPIIKAVIENIKKMTDEEIVQILVDLTRFHGTPPGEPKYYEFWSQIDDNCWDRYRTWKWPMLLKVMNVFYKLGINRSSKYCHKALIKLSRKIDLLPPRILVEMMFYQSVIRHKDVPMFDVEVRLNQVIDDLTVDEIGIVCLSFFKTETKIRDQNILIKIYKRVIEEISEIKEITLVNFLKTFRYSSKPQLCEYMNDFFIRIIPHLDKFNILTIVHIALLGTNLQILNKELMEHIVKRANSEIETARLKDIERISLTIALFDLKTDSGIEIEFMKNVLDQLKKRVNEIVVFPRCYTSTIHYLSIKGIYDIELLKAALKEKYLHFTYGKNHFNYSQETLCLDSFTRINLKDIYDGPQLSERLRKGIATYTSHYIPYSGQPHKLTHTDKILLDVHEYSEKLFGKNIITQALPHFSLSDVIFCFDENGKSVTEEIIDLFSPRRVHSGLIYSKERLLSQRKPFSDNIDKYKMIALVIGGWNFFIRETEIPTGIMRLKLEQLKMIGYTPVLIFWKEWINKSLQHREDYLTKKVKEIIRQ